MYDVSELNGMDILEVAEKLEMPLVRHGPRVMTKCLWHNDTNPSLQLGGKGYNNCRCYVCQKSWSVISMVMAYRGNGFRDACEWLMGERIHYDSNDSYSHSRKKEDEGKASICTFPLSMVQKAVEVDSSLRRCLMRRFPRERVEEVMRMYCVGGYGKCGREDDVMFPSIDKDDVVRDIKIQWYYSDPLSPRFFHNDKSWLFWLGPVLQQKGAFPRNGIWQRNCLFGEHLLKRFPDKVVALVESPKNAIVCACENPEILWVATGNKGMLRRDVLEVLHGRIVMVYPDNDAMEEWCDTLEKMQDIAHFHICTSRARDRKGDIADAILE